MLNSNRDSQGVAIPLRQEGVIAWKAAGSELHNDFGACIIASPLLLRDIHHKYVSVSLVLLLVIPPDDVWNEYLDKLTTCIE